MTLTIRTTYPCCGKPARFEAVDGIPKEKYSRRCRECETAYSIARRAVWNQNRSMRIDILDWLDTKSREYRRQYT